MADPSTMASAVDKSIDSAGILDRHKGAARLAQRYATLIDQAQHASKYRAPLDDLRRALDMLSEFEPLAAITARKALIKLADVLGEHSVMSDLGPKLLAALTALGLTVPATPTAQTPPKGSDSDGAGNAPAPAESQFERARRERAERRAGAH